MIGVLVYDCINAVNILCRVVVCVKSFVLGLESSSSSQLLALYSLQNIRHFRESQCIRQATPNQTGSSRRLIPVDVLEIARSACPNELVWQELSLVQWRFVESRKSKRSLENTTMSNESIPRRPPHHIIEPSDLRDTARAQINMVCRRGVALKSAPFSGSRN